MAIVVQSQPEAHGLAHNDNPYVFFSTSYTPTQRFKVAILPSDWPTSPELSIARVYPRVGVTTGGSIQLNKAFYDPSRVLQNQIASQVAIPSSNHSGVFDASNIHTEYVLLIVEEDLVGGVYVNGSSWFSTLKSVWNGVSNKLDWLTFDSDDYDMNAGNSLKGYLSKAPLTQYINTGQSAFLYYLSSDNNVTKCNVASYDANGVSLQTGYFEISTTNKYAYVAVGTKDLTTSSASIWTGATPSNIIDGASYYDVTLEGTALQKTVRYYIDAKCSKYEPIRLHWLNSLGGIDSFNFNAKSTEDTRIKRATYSQDEHTFTGTKWEYGKESRGTTDYHITTQDKLTVNTDYLTEEQSELMKDLFSSPIIFQELNGSLIAMSGKPKKISKQTSLNDKLMQYTFEMDYALTNNRQRG